MTITLRLAGMRGAGNAPLDIRDDDGSPLLLAHPLGVAAARGAAPVQELALAADDPVCLRLAGGGAWWMRAGEAKAALALLDDGDVFGIDAYAVDVCAPVARVAAWFERRQLGGPPGLVALDPAPPQVRAVPAAAMPADGALLLLHGTASSCQATFGALAGPDPAHAGLRALLARRYDGRLFGWQYRSLTASPLENALALAEALPAGCRLDLLTHSQGGLLGELLCLAERDGAPLTPALLDALFGGEAGEVVRLLALLDEKAIRVGRYVRIACPALGTTLASGRLDRWLSLFAFSLELAGVGGAGAPLLALLLAAVRQHADPHTLPGLAGMMPGAPLLRLLNWTKLRTRSDLSVIAGAADTGPLWRRAGLALAERFFDGPSDLVVNTASMYGGLRREHARFVLDSGARVTHFGYLAEPRLAALAGAALARADGDDAGFAPLTPDMPQEPARALQAAPVPPRMPPAVAPTPVKAIALRICHGDLAHAAHPVCVGHYEGDAIVHAEASLDAALGGLLARRAALGVYPGPAGTWLTCLAGGGAPSGALVLGLGQVGALTPGGLEDTLYGALLDHALRVAGPARLSVRLIGTGAGGIGLRDSLLAILRALARANAALAPHGPGFDAVDILELYQDLALQAAATAARLLADTALGAAFDWPVAVVADTGGGLQRARADEAPGWWRRLEIARRGDTLHFVAHTERARAEEALLPAQTRLARDFLVQATAGSARDPELARTLFEMLLPAGLKQAMAERRDTVLLLDEDAAALPWELLEDRWSGAAPPAVAAGLLRQLRLAHFRPAPPYATGRTALVIGNPVLQGADPAARSPYADLPGARAEAAAVADRLAAAGFEVAREIDSDAAAIVIALHAAPWRILHLAGHGVLADGGMLVGPDTLLTPADVGQMRRVPELVFVNCCYLGATGGAARPHELAASLGVQFIAMGVRAVVAAGWQVDDAAGATFAGTFYGALAAGDPFGRAVQRAREAAWRGHPDVNTWGAYQCYGDPAYTSGAGAAPLPDSAQPLFGSAELLCELDNLLAAGTPSTAALEARIPAAVRAQWLALPAVAAKLAALRAQPEKPS
jgi:hypothetical protein